MKVLIFLTLAGLAASLDLEHVLQSPTELKNLFSEFNAQYGKSFSRAEAPMRMRLFRNDLKQIVKLNKEHDWVSGINQFTAMTAAEKQMYLGLNVTLSAPAPEDNMPPREDLPPRASSLDWREKGKVTAVKNQGQCGSCWAFSAVAAVETGYAIVAGKRKAFSEQEYLDCTYEGKADGCAGGWYHEAWDYSVKTGRLATQAAAPYKARDGACSYDSVHNGLIAASISGSKAISKGESSVIQALDSGAVSVAYEVTNAFYRYRSGVIRDDTCKGSANHAAAAVGYTENSMIVKNSWGSRWGMSGYFQTGRNHHGCSIWNHGYLPSLKETGKDDTDPEN